MKLTNQAFTIVELIVVITILAILWTIWFVSFSSHLVWTRDTNRLSQLSTMHEWLDVYSTQNELPTPENSVEVRASWSLIWYQWYAWKNVLGMIWYSKWWKDPKDEEYYSYYLTEDKKHFQLMAFLEDEWNKQNTFNILNQANATDYTRRYPTVYWKKLGILTESGINAPIHEVSSIVSSWYLDVVTTLKDYKAYFTDQDTISGTWNILWVIPSYQKTFSSCKEISDSLWYSWSTWRDWVYMLNTIWKSNFKVYCDMTTYWWWWTLLLMNREKIESWSSAASKTTITKPNYNEWKKISLNDSVDLNSTINVVTNAIENVKFQEIRFQCTWSCPTSNDSVYKHSDVSLISNKRWSMSKTSTNWWPFDAYTLYKSGWDTSVWNQVLIDTIMIEPQCAWTSSRPYVACVQIWLVWFDYYDFQNVVWIWIYWKEWYSETLELASPLWKIQHRNYSNLSWNIWIR